jgi:hypothetical protein
MGHIPFASRTREYLRRYDARASADAASGVHPMRRAGDRAQLRLVNPGQ